LLFRKKYDVAKPYQHVDPIVAQLRSTFMHVSVKTGAKIKKTFSLV